jgi:hypothetical protein
MLRHKAMIQAARYAFGFSGIYDEDEGSKIAEMRDITPATDHLAKKTLTPPRPPKASAEPVKESAPIVDEVQGNGEFDLGEFMENLETSMLGAKDEASVEEIWTDFDAPATLESEGHANMIDAALSVRERAFARLSLLNGA